MTKDTTVYLGHILDCIEACPKGPSGTFVYGNIGTLKSFAGRWTSRATNSEGT